MIHNDAVVADDDDGDAGGNDDGVLQQRQIQFCDVLRRMLVSIACQTIADIYLLDSRNRRAVGVKEQDEEEKKEKNGQWSNESKQNQLMLLIIAARIEQLPLQIPYPPKNDDNVFFLQYLISMYRRQR